MTKTIGICPKQTYYSSPHWREPGQQIEWTHQNDAAFYMIWADTTGAVEFRLRHPDLELLFVEDEGGGVEELLSADIYLEKEVRHYQDSRVRLAADRINLILRLVPETGWVTERIIADYLAASGVGLTAYEWESLSRSCYFRRQRRKAGYVYQLSKEGVGLLDSIIRQERWDKERREREEQSRKRQEEHEAFMAKTRQWIADRGWEVGQ